MGIDRQRLEEIKQGTTCPKGFPCEESDFKRICRARHIGMESFVECLEENPRACPFVMPFGDGYFCKCPLRVFVARQESR